MYFVVFIAKLSFFVASIIFSLCFQLGDGDFKRSRSWRKKFKKDRGRDRREHPVLTRRGSTESDISQQSGSSGSENLNSPAHRNKKSPLAGKLT